MRRKNPPSLQFFNGLNPHKHSVYAGFHLPIISYQEQKGNYNLHYRLFYSDLIISYQEQKGNYNSMVNIGSTESIISYQEQKGNYNRISEMP